MGVRFIRIAVIYLLIGACVGLGMGMSQQFTLAPVHAHLLLLGWASMALAGLIYHWHPAAGATLLARIHFWVHNLALPVFMVSLGLLLTGTEAAMPFVAGAATFMLVGLALFAANVIMNVKAA
jgi:hypothetical protein